MDLIPGRVRSLLRWNRGRQAHECDEIQAGTNNGTERATRSCVLTMMQVTTDMTTEMRASAPNLAKPVADATGRRNRRIHSLMD